MPTIANSKPTVELLLLTLSPDGQAYLNREASRYLPAPLHQVRLVPPAPGRESWWLLPEVPGGVRVRARPDRLGYLRFWAPGLAAHAFAAHPPGTARIYLELAPLPQGWFALHFIGTDA